MPPPILTRLRLLAALGLVQGCLAACALLRADWYVADLPTADERGSTASNAKGESADQPLSPPSPMAFVYIEYFGDGELRGADVVVNAPCVQRCGWSWLESVDLSKGWKLEDPPPKLEPLTLYAWPMSRFRDASGEPLLPQPASGAASATSLGRPVESTKHQGCPILFRVDLAVRAGDAEAVAAGQFVSLAHASLPRAFPPYEPAAQLGLLCETRRRR
jgi:hypothetical protein